ncbi:uncharacterized protein [Pyrus communis]|uniref:uncharacterized protein n=1 Tax=Pyrus communis TaxID=23211 RepID=UPI0035C05E08
MIEGRNDGFENKGPAANYMNANYYPARAPLNYAYDHLAASACATEDHGVRKDHLGVEDFSGYIFMCNGRTKPECYLYRVFGLPAGRREVIEMVRPGTKLFLFDYDVKFLYGVYEATTAGKMNLERTAFGGSFPAQVRFNTYKECLPLSESDFKHAILDNYQKGSKKFNPILNSQQVSHLLSLFHPITTQSPVKHDRSYRKDQYHPYPRLPPSGTTYLNSMRLSQPPQVLVPRYVPPVVLVHQWDGRVSTGNMGLSHHAEHPALSNAGSQSAIPTQYTEEQFQSPASLPSVKDPNAASVYSSLTSPLLEPQYIPPNVIQQQPVSYGYISYMGNIYPAVQPQAMPAPNQTYYSAQVAHSYSAELPVSQAPTSYESYHSHEATQNAVPNDQHTSLGYRYNQLPSQAETGIQQGNAAKYYSLYQVPTLQYVSSPVQTHLNNIGSTWASSRDSSSLNSAPTH